MWPEKAEPSEKPKQVQNKVKISTNCKIQMKCKTHLCALTAGADSQTRSHCRLPTQESGSCGWAGRQISVLKSFQVLCSSTLVDVDAGYNPQVFFWDVCIWPVIFPKLSIYSVVKTIIWVVQPFRILSLLCVARVGAGHFWSSRPSFLKPQTSLQHSQHSSQGRGVALGKPSSLQPSMATTCSRGGAKGQRKGWRITLGKGSWRLDWNKELQGWIITLSILCKDWLVSLCALLVSIRGRSVESKYPARGLTHLGKKSAIADGSSGWRQAACSFPRSADHPACGASSPHAAGCTAVCRFCRTRCWVPSCSSRSPPTLGKGGWIHYSLAESEKKLWENMVRVWQSYLFFFFLFQRERASRHLPSLFSEKRNVCSYSAPFSSF